MKDEAAAAVHLSPAPRMPFRTGKGAPQAPVSLRPAFRSGRSFVESGIESRGSVRAYPPRRTARDGHLAGGIITGNGTATGIHREDLNPRRMEKACSSESTARRSNVCR